MKKTLTLVFSLMLLVAGCEGKEPPPLYTFFSAKTNIYGRGCDQCTGVVQSTFLQHQASIVFLYDGKKKYWSHLDTSHFLGYHHGCV